MLTKLKYKLWKHLNKQFTNNKVEQSGTKFGIS